MERLQILFVLVFFSIVFFPSSCRLLKYYFTFILNMRKKKIGKCFHAYFFFISSSRVLNDGFHWHSRTESLFYAEWRSLTLKYTFLILFFFIKSISIFKLSLWKIKLSFLYLAEMNQFLCQKIHCLPFVRIGIFHFAFEILQIWQCFYWKLEFLKYNNGASKK